MVESSVKKSKRITIIGKNDNNTSNITNGDNSNKEVVKLQGVPKTVSLHVYRLTPNTSVDQVVQFLKPHFPEVSCEKLASKYPDVYSSFKVNIFANNFDAAMDPTIWPNNACVRRFLYHRQKAIVNSVQNLERP